MGINQDTFDDYHSSLQSLALASVRNAVAFPQDISFHRSMSSGFARDLEEVEKRVLRLTNKLLDLSASLDTSREGSRKEKEKARLQDEDDVTDSFHSAVVDVVDQLLERTDTCLDRYLGRIKPPAVTVNPPTAAPRKAQNRSQLQPVIQHASHISKPQLAFFRPVDNSDAPWRPSLKHKYHAKVPLGHAYRGDHPMEGEVSQPSPNHPYHYELIHLEYPSHVFQAPTDSKPPKGLEDTTFHWVSTPLETRAMLEKLRHCQEIAVDLEWHGYRTYRGFLCLMQLSTRDGDWVVDVLSLRQVQGGIEELESLGEVFANPNIVLHGADSDIVWLQQDFNLYIVNMFDTYHASKLLAFPRHGLANLLEMYCDFIPDKRYQLADWRIRPLPSDMLQYARSDTHFLLYIYDQLRLALVDRSSSRPESPSLIHQNTEQGDSSRRFVREILSRSTETCLKVYCKEAYDEEAGTGRDGWDTLGRKWNKPQFCHSFANLENASSVIRMQRAVYQALHKWRDQVAREEDESTRYVLPNHHLFQLAERPPNDMATLLTLFTSFPPVIKRRAKELLTVIRRTVQQYSTATGRSDTPLVSTAERTGELLESATVGSQLRPSPPPNTSHRDLWSLGE
ncbi:hypothetical protein BDN72DRAFT_767808 [Pluteus cervinus]|uniref:Uncharacterized protein n=1 Tax=Pluteus cervinus TaxID=181527 RepID=A0ACD3AV99_9AGAR|nr:hypothetical protein BDN72DRAFT_767808 [Pluteus cervinus]